MVGECERLIRATDWAGTPLGPIEAWPPALTSALDLCLSSRLPHVLCWGPQFLMLYNDDLIPIIGRHRHPAAMAQPVFGATPEGRALLEPMLQQVFSTGVATWTEDLMVPLEREGRPAERYFTFTYSPVHDRGEVAGVICAVVETTDRVIELRRLRLIATLVEATRANTPIEACEMIAAEPRRSSTMQLRTGRAKQPAPAPSCRSCAGASRSALSSRGSRP